jgi:FkbM family methyltransferase
MISRALAQFEANFRSSPTPASAARVRQYRLALAEILAGIAPEVARELYATTLKPFLAGPRPHLPPGAPCGAEDRVLAWARQTLASAIDVSHALLVAMLLWSPEDAPSLDDLSRCPAWLVDDYMAYLLRVPPGFQDETHRARYGAHLRRVVSCVESLCRSRPHDPAAHQIARAFTLFHNFVPAYFLDGNLKGLFRSRARIIEHCLAAAGYRLPHAFPPPTGSRKKLGLLVLDLSPRTETFYVLAVIEHLEMAGWDIVVFPGKIQGHPLESVFEQRCSIVPLPADTAGQVERIRSYNLDMLLAGSNVTAVCNTVTLIAAHRLARLQVALMTSPVTTGFTHTDALLSSEWNEPPEGAAGHYTEKLAVIAGSLNCYAYHHDTAPATVEVSRSRLHLPEDSVVFFSGANYFKIMPELSEAWVAILAAVPGSYLVLMPFNPNWSSQYEAQPLIDRIESQMRSHGVDPARLRIVSPVPQPADVQRIISACDVYLDSYPFSGACSLIDPLTTGVPVVAWKGDTARSLHSYSILRGLALEEFAASSRDEYVDLAVKLGTSPKRREEFKVWLASLHVGALPFLDTAEYGKRVSRALADLYQDYWAAEESGQKASIESLEQEIASLAQEAADTPQFRALNDLAITDRLIRPVLREQVAGVPTPHLVDVGACYGQISLPFVDEGWSADLFEPDARARAALLARLAGRSRRTRVFEHAVAADNSAAVAFYNSSSPGLSGLAKPVYGSLDSTTEVPCVRLADFLPRRNVDRVDFLKVDAEGWDFDVLRGHDFSRFPPKLILVEYSTASERQALPRLRETIEWMQGQGYRAVIFAASDDSNFRKGVWDFDVRSIHAGVTLASVGEGFGNIVFHPASDKHFLAALRNLLLGLRKD